MKAFLGIDPGKSGALAVVFENGEVGRFIKLASTERDIAIWLEEEQKLLELACIEKVGATPQMGVVSAFTFGQSLGFCIGLLSSFGVGYMRVAPRTWQKELDCLSGGNKNVTKQAAQQLWPRMKFTHANADAYLLAEFAHRTFFTRSGKEVWK